jgi:hypothetical protein
MSPFMHRHHDLFQIFLFSWCILMGDLYHTDIVCIRLSLHCEMADSLAL